MSQDEEVSKPEASVLAPTKTTVRRRRSTVDKAAEGVETAPKPPRTKKPLMQPTRARATPAEEGVPAQDPDAKPTRRRAAAKPASEEAAAPATPATPKPARAKAAAAKTTAHKKAAAQKSSAEVPANAEKPAPAPEVSPVQPQQRLDQEPAPAKPSAHRASAQRSSQQNAPSRNNNNAPRNNNNGHSANNRPSNNGGRDGSANNNHRRQRRPYQNNNGGTNNGATNNSNRNSNREPVVPQTTREGLNELKVADLRAKAVELGVEAAGLKKADLVEVVFAASMKAEGFIDVEGILDILADGYGFLRTQGYLPGESDVYVGLSTIRRNGLRKGDYVVGRVRPARDNEKYAAVQKLVSVNKIPVDALGKRPRFADLTPIFPDQRLLMEHGKSAITARVIDLAAPIGKGQRGLIVSPPKAGKTTILKDIAAAISANNPEVHLMCLLVDERPEEVTDMERSIKGEVISSTFDMPCENHIAVAEMVVERAKRLVECGEDVVILLDSLTRLARAYNLAQPASGRILSGGVDSTALYPPKRFLGAARNIEGGGSLTILASALIDTGSKMDEVIFEEFKGTGNMELKLDRNLADRRIFPAIDPVSSGTRKEDLLLDPQEAPLIWAVRRILANMNSTERAMDMLIKSLKQTDTNQEFLLRTAKKAQGRRNDESLAF
ncbi:MAG: transcription termination factor Rho [Raoultibacter sp.]